MSKVKILLTGDWHLGKKLLDFPLLEHQKFYLEKLAERIEEVRPDIIIIAGDIYDSKNPDKDALSTISLFLKKVRRNKDSIIIYIAGNHDNPALIHYLNPILKDLGIIAIGYDHNPFEPLPIDQLKIYAIPWMLYSDYIRILETEKVIGGTEDKKDARKYPLRMLINELVKRTDGNCILIGHFHPSMRQTEEMHEIVGYVEPVPVEILSQFKLVLSGHLHKQLILHEYNCYWAGSPYSLGLPPDHHHGNPILLHVNPDRLEIYQQDITKWDNIPSGIYVNELECHDSEILQRCKNELERLKESWKENSKLHPVLFLKVNVIQNNGNINLRKISEQLEDIAHSMNIHLKLRWKMINPMAKTSSKFVFQELPGSIVEKVKDRETLIKTYLQEVHGIADNEKISKILRKINQLLENT